MTESPEDLWGSLTDTPYGQRKVKEVLDYLGDKRLMEDDEWATLAELNDKLYLPEHTAIGIVFYLWAWTNQIQVKPDPEGRLLMRIRWD